MDPNNVVYSSNPDDFDIKQPIGYGSSATVYLAIYKPKNLKVAVKVIDMDMFERNQIDELRKETQVMFLCRHPNLLPVYCSYVLESKLHIIMPYLTSGSCLDILKHGYTEGLEEIYIASILKQALLGLEYLHKNGHIHRDIKAGNLLITGNGQVLLADFGVSSSLSDYGDRSKLRKTFVGTPCWMAPEVMEQAGYDSKADIWSFGITALELANGQAPLAKYPPIKVLMLTLSKDPPTLDRENTKYKYSRAFKEMIDCCLQKEPSKRYTAEKLLNHPFFKQVKKIANIAPLVQNLPPIENRPGKARQIAPIKLPAQGDSWNFSPAIETAEKTTYFDDSSGTKELDNQDNPQIHEILVSPMSNLTTISEDPSIAIPSPLTAPTSARKSRFVINTTNLEKHEATLSPMTPGEVKKGRFSVSDRSISPVPNANNTNGSVEQVNQLPLTRDISKSSRFSVSSDAGSPTNGEQQVLASTTPTTNNFEKRGRFQVSNENGEGINGRAVADNASVDELGDNSNTLMMHATQLDAILKQNESQHLMLSELQKTIKSGNGGPSQNFVERTLTDQAKISSKSEGILSDTMITFQQLIQNILQENSRLKSENELLRTDLEKLKLGSGNISTANSSKSLFNGVDSAPLSAHAPSEYGQTG